MEVIERPDRESRTLFAVLSVCLVICVGLVDYATGYDVVISLFYLLPIALMVWFVGPVAGRAVALASGVADIISTLIAGYLNLPPILHLWNMIIKLAFYLVFAHVLIQLKNALDRERELSRTDPLTGLTNTRAFSEIGSAEIARMLRYKHPFTVAYMDIDNFKSVNDSAGHSAGDDLLRVIGGMLKSSIRATDVAARLGGDEFAILMPETGPEEVKPVIQRVRKNLMDITAHDVHVHRVTFSIGVITNIDRPCGFDVMLKAADDLMYKAKESGKNTVKESVFGAEVVS